VAWVRSTALTISSTARAVKVLSRSDLAHWAAPGAERCPFRRAPAHPNIVAVYDAGERRPPHIVMQLVEAIPARRAAGDDRGNHGHSAGRAALEHAHAHGIVHRDGNPRT
jgi:hypothetical protein